MWMKNNLSSALVLDRRIFKFIKKYVKCELKYTRNILFVIKDKIWLWKIFFKQKGCCVT